MSRTEHLGILVSAIPADWDEAEISARLEEHQFGAASELARLCSALEEAKKVITKQNDAVTELLGMDELQLLANKKQFSFRYLRQTLEAANAWLEGHHETNP